MDNKRSSKRPRDAFDRIAADLRRISQAKKRIDSGASVTIDLDQGLDELLALRTAQASVAYGAPISVSQVARAAMMRGLRRVW